VTGTKLSHAEIARQAADRSHLEPDPILCLPRKWVCTACGESVDVNGSHALPWEWRSDHSRGACQGQSQGGAKERSGGGMGSDVSGGPRRVLGAKDSKDGGAG
jgi:hypothetical protein